MAFTCEKCGTAQPPRTKPQIVVTERRADGSTLREMKLCLGCATDTPGAVVVAGTGINTLADNTDLAALRAELPPGEENVDG